MFLLEQIQANEFHNKKYCKKRDFSLFFLFATLFFIHIKNVTQRKELPMIDYRHISNKDTKDEKMEKYKYVFTMLFGRDDEYFSNIFFATRNKGKLNTIGALSNNEFLNVLSNKEHNNFEKKLIKRIWYKKDLYISFNGFNWKERARNKISSFYNVCVDIDCHFREYGNSLIEQNMKGYALGMKRDNEFENHVDELIDLIREVSQNEDFVLPYMFVKTGRGLQVWYSIEPIPATQKFAYDFFREDVLEFYRNLFKKFDNVTWLFKLDEKISYNDAGLVRFPATYNSKVKYWGEVIIENEDKTNVHEYYFKNKVKKKITKAKLYVPDLGYYKPYINRRQLFENLIDYRNKEGLNEGYRNNLLFVAYNNERSAGLNNEEAMEYITYLNSQFNKPLPHKEMTGILKTSNRRGKYNLSNKSIIQYLCLSSEECDTLNFHEFISRAEKSKKVKEKKDKRNKQIIELYEQGLTQTEISEKCNCSQATVCRVLKSLTNKNNKKERETEIRKDNNIKEEKKTILKTKTNNVTLTKNKEIQITKLCKNTYTKFNYVTKNYDNLKERRPFKKIDYAANG